MSSKMFMSFFLHLQRLFEENIPGLYHIVDLNGGQRFECQHALSMQLQRALHDSSRGLRVLSNKLSSIFSASISSAMRMYVLGDIGKVTRDVGGSTDPVFTKRTCKKKSNAL